MNDVELVGALADLFERHDVIGQVILDRRIEPERSYAAGDEFGGRNGVTGREQGQLMTLANQFLGQVRNDAFRSAIELRGNAFE